VYCGRVVAVGLSPDRKPFVGYRISSRSFPNREIQLETHGARAIPRPGFEDDLKRNPFISYRCLRELPSAVLAANGSQLDPIAVKVERGMPVKDAIVLGLLACDYEGDAFDTPRIVCAADGGWGHLGIVTRDTLEVVRFPLAVGLCRLVATNELTRASGEEHAFAATKAEEAARYLVQGGIFGEMTNAVATVAWLGGEMATLTV
jgi:IMP cyclohydrolase